MTDTLTQIQSTPIRLFVNKNGAPNVELYGGARLHSTYDPEKEAIRQAHSILQENPNSPLLVVGVGLGYLLNAIRQIRGNHSGQTILFYEPLASLQEILNETDHPFLNPVRSEIEHSLYFQLEDLQHAMKHRSISSVRIVVSPSYARLFPGLFEQVAAYFQKTSLGTEESTRARFARQWMRNHIRLLHSQKTLNFFRGSEGTIPPVLYAGASPRLLADLKPLRTKIQIQEQTFIIASDTSLGPLLSEGIRPHLVLSVDSGRGTLYHLRAAALHDTVPFPFPVLGWTASLPHLSQFFHETLYYRSTLPLDQLEGTGPLEKEPVLQNTTGNLSGLALMVAGLLGKDTIYFLGTGFVSVHGQSHERGTGYSLHTMEQHSRLNPSELYASRGYSSTLTMKNKKAMDELDQMSSKWKIRIRTLPDQIDFLMKDVTRNPEAVSFIKNEITTEELRNHLNGILNKNRYEDIPDRVFIWMNMTPP